MGVLTVPLGVVVAAVLISAVTDIWKFKVHNLLTFPLLISGLIYHSIVYGGAGFLMSMAGALCGFLLLVTMVMVGGMGAGDVKLMAAIGAWLGLPWTFYVFIASSLAAGVYALVIIFLYHRTEETWLNLRIIWYRVAAIGRRIGSEDRIESEVARQDRRGRIIPFAAMIALGVIGLIIWNWCKEAN